MTTISAKLQAVLSRIETAARAAGRLPDEVALLAVSKTWPATRIREAAAAGQRRFGENYVQEGVGKTQELKLLNLEWHFIGPLQGNKTRPIAETFDWVHSIDRLKIAERLSAQRPAELAPLQVCIQVNVSGEETKSGVSLAQLAELARGVANLPRINLRGLMAIPAPSEDVAEQRRAFRALRDAYEKLQSDGYPLDTLSMGMSDDLEAAIAEGATVVRVGTAIFGERSGL
ncbi:YggS family pyridoxal phosphate-dependent enzyme [Propionivibrio soli]|uniref:YggS family pyridoxal phosphate-dependent enzyme n=1 Tax=Propionivibrio soli TaxID=2976531 RepID=UPI0021E8E3B6|nr:YggS family pyridoxal phosphate-dependent enzyme [Propionivibrio soli]